MTNKPSPWKPSRTEMLIVVVVIGVLAFFAIPRYGDFQPVAQVTLALETLQAQREHLVRGHAATGQWPALPPFAPTPHVQSITIQEVDHRPPGTLMLVATMAQGENVRQEVRGKTLTLATSDGGQSWNCRSGTLEERFTPWVCKDGHPSIPLSSPPLPVAGPHERTSGVR